MEKVENMNKMFRNPQNCADNNVEALTESSCVPVCQHG